VEAISHLMQGLALLQTLPETPERTWQELTLQTAIGPALMATKGQGAQEVGQAYARARELCQQVGEDPQLFPVLFGLWRFYTVQGEQRTAREMAEQCLGLAQRLHDPALLLPAHFTVGGSLYCLGEMASARPHLEQGIALYNPQEYRSLAFHYGMDLGAWCLSYASWVLWLLGHPDQAQRRAHEALTLARDLSHPFSLAATLVYVTITYSLIRREGHAIRERAEAAVALASEQGFPQWLALGTFLRGWALAAQGLDEEGFTQMRQELAAFRATGARIGVTWNLAYLAAAYGKLGQVAEGLSVLAEALALADTTGERMWEVELYRLQGELLQKATSGVQKAVMTPEACFQQALTVARHQEARSLELRAAMSLSRLWQQRGKRAEAYNLLAPIYGWFTEGFDTADLQEAKALLEELS
jgi:predicted ATPase